MKQAERFLFRPNVFFSQLQWSSSHWFILVAFLVAATVETHVGQYSELYLLGSFWVQQTFGLGLSASLWVLTVAKLAVMLGAAYLMACFIWVVGNLIGKKRSRRVLFRRLAVVFTVLLLARTADHLSYLYPVLAVVSIAFYTWGAILGLIAIREQFLLSTLETAVVAGLSMIVFMSSYHVGYGYVEQVAENTISEIVEGIAHRPEPGSRVR